MGIFGNIFGKEKELSTTDKGDKCAPIIDPIDTFREEMINLNGKMTNLGKIRLINISGHDPFGSRLGRDYISDPMAIFELYVNISSIFPIMRINDFNTSCGYTHFNSEVGKIRLSDPQFEGINEVDIYGCKIIFTISKRQLMNGLVFAIQETIELERKFNNDSLLLAYPNYISTTDVCGNTGPSGSTSYGTHKININFTNRINYQISDISEINNLFDSIKTNLKDTIEKNFYREALNLKGKILKEKILKDFNDSINEEVINDVFAHVIDSLGIPEIHNNSQNHNSRIYNDGGWCITFPCKSINGIVVLDDKMNESLYEITESINRIKDCYDKAKIALQINGTGIIIYINPDIDQYEMSDNQTFRGSTSSYRGGTSSYHREVDNWGTNGIGALPASIFLGFGEPEVDPPSDNNFDIY